MFQKPASMLWPTHQRSLFWEAEHLIVSRDRAETVCCYDPSDLLSCIGTGETQHGPGAEKLSLGGNERSLLVPYTEGIASRTTSLGTRKRSRQFNCIFRSDFRAARSPGPGLLLQVSPEVYADVIWEKGFFLATDLLGILFFHKFWAYLDRWSVHER